MLQFVAMCCSLSQCVAVCRNVLQFVEMCCSLSQCVAVCCNVLHEIFLCVQKNVAVFRSVFQFNRKQMQYVAVFCIVCVGFSEFLESS